MNCFAVPVILTNMTEFLETNAAHVMALVAGRWRVTNTQHQTEPIVPIVIKHLPLIMTLVSGI
jgi:hypothetical protein